MQTRYRYLLPQNLLPFSSPEPQRAPSDQGSRSENRVVGDSLIETSRLLPLGVIYARPLPTDDSGRYPPQVGGGNDHNRSPDRERLESRDDAPRPDFFARLPAAPGKHAFPFISLFKSVRS